MPLAEAMKAPNFLDRGFKHAAMTSAFIVPYLCVFMSLCEASSHPSRPRMKRPVHLLQILPIDMGINLRR